MISTISVVWLKVNANAVMLSPYIVAQKSTENYFHKYFTENV